MNNTKLEISSEAGNKKTSSLTVTFRTRENSKGLSINVRLGYNGETFDKFTGIRCQKGEFKNGKVKANPEANLLLSTYQNNLEQAFYQLQIKGQIIDLQRIANSMFGKPVIEETPHLFKALDKYVQTKWLDAGTDFSDITKLKNQRYFNHLKQWAKSFFGREIIDLSEVKSIHDNEIIKFMIAQRGSGHNHSTMHVQRFKGFFDYAIGNDWIGKNPFMNFKPKHEKVKIRYLTKEQLTTFESLPLSKDSTYELVRDLFTFSCYTGLSYMDLKNVAYDHVKTDSEGTKYLEISRLKTDVTAIVPLLKKPLELIEKYRLSDKQVKMFSVPTNQCMNRVLKELADLSRIKTKLTFRISRSTCGTLLISEGVDMAIVKAVLGHSSINTTINHYAIVEAKAVINSFKRVYHDNENNHGII